MVNKTRLYAWKTGALEPQDQLEVEEAFRADPTLLARALALPDPDPPPERSWRIPPQGWGLQAELLQAAVLRGSLRVGDRFQVALDDLDGERTVVVLRDRDGWEPVFPLHPSAAVPLQALPVRHGRRVLDLSADRTPGHQRWAIALPRAELLGPPWEALMAALAAGTVPVIVVSVEVAPAV